MKQHTKWIALGLVVVALAGCGRKGPLEPVGGAAPVQDEKLATGADIGLTTGKKVKPTPVQPGNTAFILDPLL